jgi:hypothetical protein
MSDGDWALALACYLLLHCLAYIFDFRRRRFFRTERGILLFHVISALAVSTIMAGVFSTAPSVDRFALLIGAGAAHGIYSLSFLEIWVLSEGGYSLRVLNELVARGAATTDELERKFIDLSVRKKSGRIESLGGLGLIAVQGDRIALTCKGRGAAAILATIAAMAGFGRRGE